MKIWIPDALPHHEQSFLGELLRGRGYDPLFTSQTSHAGVLLIGGAPRAVAELRGAQGLRVVIRYARGRYDLEEEQNYCREAGLAYERVSGMSARSTAEHTLMLMLALLRQLPLADALVRNGAWGQRETSERGIRDLSHASVGLIGLGRVGRRVAELLRAFETGEVYYFKTSRLPPSEEERLGVSWLPLDEMLPHVDVVSVHTRTQGATEPVLTRKHVASLKPGAILINTGDGRHVDQAALTERIQSGELMAGLDVYPREPWVPSPEMAARSAHTLFTPHVAGRGSSVAHYLFTRVVQVMEQLLESAPAPKTGRA